MSMSNWTSHAFGVTDEVLTALDPRKILKTAEEKLKDEYKTEFHDIAASAACMPELKTEPVYTLFDWSDGDDDDGKPVNQLWDIVSETDATGIVSAALVMLVLQELKASPYWVFSEMNFETGDMIAGISLGYPWEAPDDFRGITEDKVTAAFIKVIADLGLNVDPKKIGDHELENWG